MGCLAYKCYRFHAIVQIGIAETPSIWYYKRSLIVFNNWKKQIIDFSYYITLFTYCFWREQLYLLHIKGLSFNDSVMLIFCSWYYCKLQCNYFQEKKPIFYLQKNGYSFAISCMNLIPNWPFITAQLCISIYWPNRKCYMNLWELLMQFRWVFF